ncbi:hypothetical protein [Winogradskyella vincentii]|nr:hypothetical protein [Winogradskyella vincentii]
MVIFKIALHVFIVIVLTILTQIGGLMWLLCLIICYKWKKKKRYVFPILYLAFNLFVIPITAPLFGRTKLPVTSNTLKPHNLIYPLLFRNYVSKELNSLLLQSSIDLAHLGIRVTYLDANFPFIDGFPLLPHISHDDGNKIDIAFMYLENGKKTNKKPSTSGYGAYTSDSNPTLNYCKSIGFWQYDITKYLTFGSNKELTLDKENTKTLIQGLLYRAKNSKIFIEPYLKKELKLQDYNEIRFHGCQSVRHDDHIHFEIK